MSDLAVTLTVQQLEELMRKAVREEMGVRLDAAEVLTREQAADLLQVHPHLVTRFVKTRDLPGRKIGAEWRFRRSELLAWLNTQRGGT